MRVAVIDLGTNTCNLLIAEMNSLDYKILHQSKQLVKLGDNKIRENEISAAATTRVLESIQIHKKIISDYHAEKVRVVATSAVRTAENKIAFLEQISENSGWIVKLISGEKEAELIFEGVLLAFNEFKNPALILDIGGGSNELIVAHHKQMLWKESQPTGMARIINKFKLSDPILSDEINSLKNHFAEAHKNAFEKCKTENIKTLVGCSGAFDTIADIIDSVNPGEKLRTTQEISISEFYIVYQNLLKSTREQRLLMKGMDNVRIDLIVPAVIFIEQLISEIGINQIVQTDFALREGVLFEMMNQGHGLSISP
jgi:exopolyphosphatase/guanosine-5'-triphosphate,3'-diphosphate pyrophosphatase